jgi:hypothetical protein
MTNKVSRRRRRDLSLSMPSISNDPITQLTRIIEIFQLVNRALTTTALGREELITLGGLLTQINGALLALTDLLSSFASIRGTPWVVVPPAMPQITPHRVPHETAPVSPAERSEER